MREIAVIDDPAVAETLLAPIRSRLLVELAEPASASMLAERVGLPRQKVNYHLHALAESGLAEFVTERRKGNMTERLFRASAERYVITPDVLRDLAPDPARSPDQLSAAWLLALGARLVRDVGRLVRGAARARKPLATFAIDAEVNFASARDRAGFAADLARLTAELVDRYHDDQAPGGRRHRLVIALHPLPTDPPPTPDPGALADPEEDQS